MNASSTPAHLRPQPVFERLTSRHSYAGPDSPLFNRTGESGVSGGWVSPATPSSPTSEFVPSRETEMGEISDEDDSDFAPVDVNIRAMDDQGAEDLFFSSSSFMHSRDIGADTSFGWDSTPIVSSLTVNMLQNTPSPRSKVALVTSKLEKKYRPRDSGIVLSEDESNSAVPNSAPKFLPPAPRHRYTLGRSESVNLSMPPASTSVSTLGSGSSDQELITPIFGPSTSSAWPLLNSSSSTTSSLGVPDAGSVDAFILNALMQAERGGEHSQLMNADGGNGMRPPGTPQKRVKTAAAFGGVRLWQSAVASKIGFDFGNDEEDENEDGCAKVQADKAKAKRNKKMPRKSLPAAFPSLSKAGSGRGRAAGAEDSDDEIGQDDASPTERKALYDGIGLGRPSISKTTGTGWLLRRSSSGAISGATAGIMSRDGSPNGAINTMHGTSQQFLLLHLVPEFIDLCNRLAASTAAYSTQAFPNQVEHPKPPHLEPDRVQFVRCINSNHYTLAHKAPADGAAATNLMQTAK
jgi:mitosis inhibitor protein kinase SWE1